MWPNHGMLWGHLVSDSSLEQIVAAMHSAARTYAEAESQASRLFSV